MAHKGLSPADGRGEGGNENPMTKEVQEGGQRQISEDGGEETMMEKRLWLWILEQRRTEAGKGGGGDKKRPDERSEDDGSGKKQGNGEEEEEVGDGTGGGYDEAADQDVGGMRMVDPAGGEAVGGELGKEAVEDRERAVVLAMEGEEGREGVGGVLQQHWLLPKVQNIERKRRRGGKEAKRKEKISVTAQPKRGMRVLAAQSGAQARSPAGRKAQVAVRPSWASRLTASLAGVARLVRPGWHGQRGMAVKQCYLGLSATLHVEHCISFRSLGR